MKKKSVLNWFFEFAGIHRNTYILSIIFATLGVLCSLVPYFLIGEIVTKLLSGEKDFSAYLGSVLLILLFWFLRVLFHSFSTGLSHKATFHVLAIIRKRLCDKLYRLPLGFVKDTPSGSLKNIIV